jgi:hypothetical protein
LITVKQTVCFEKALLRCLPDNAECISVTLELGAPQAHLR